MAGADVRSPCGEFAKRQGIIHVAFPKCRKLSYSSQSPSNPVCWEARKPGCYKCCFQLIAVSYPRTLVSPSNPWTLKVLYCPQHFLNFFPLPQGHGALRPTFLSGRVAGFFLGGAMSPPENTRDGSSGLCSFSRSSGAAS